MRGTERLRLSRWLLRTCTRAAVAPAKQVAELESVRRFCRFSKPPSSAHSWLSAAGFSSLISMGMSCARHACALAVFSARRTGFAPSTSDYHFAISFDSDGFTTSCPAFVPKTTEIYCHATTPIGQPERLIRFETIWSNKSLAATQNGRFIAIPWVALIGPTDRSTGR